MRVLDYVVVVVGLAGSRQCIPTLVSETCGQEASVEPTQQGRTEIPVDTALARRWSELFAGVIGQFHAERRDLVANIEGVFTTREIRVRATSAGDNESLWVSKTLTEDQLRTADLGAIARQLYAAAKQK